MYDRSVSKEPKDASSRAGENDVPSGVSCAQKDNIQTAPSCRPRHNNTPAGTKLHLSLSPLQGKECPRPLSSSSLSSSSSSSSSSPRRDSKKLYLASIESLDDEFSEDCERKNANPRDQAPPERIRNKMETVPSYDGSQSNCSARSVGSVVVQTSGSRDSSLTYTDRVILEILETERTYVRNLKEIIEGYLEYIPGNAGSKVDTKSLTDLFCNIEDIYNFNRTFLQDLEMCGLDSVAVARCFFKHSYGFAIYTQYCTNYPRTVSILTDLMRNSETAEVFKERQIALCHNLPLGSYLLKPVQRILRYRLLLENIVKTSNTDCEGYADIKNALSVMTGIAYHINDMKKRHENAVRVQEIQSLLYGWDGHDLTTYGELVAEGAFRMYRTKTLRHLFLFDKMLLIAKKKEDGILCYKTHIMCSNLMLIESIQGEPLCFHVIPFDNPREQHTFQARNREQKREWCLQLKRVILENYNAVIPSHARQLVMELGQSKQEGVVGLEKSTSRRQLSAPEYLEKRKQERRKSESSIKPFKIKGGKKVRKLSPSFKSVASSCESRSHQLLSASYDGIESSKESTKPLSRWRRASVDALPGKLDGSSNEIQRNLRVPSYMDTSVSDSEKRPNGRFPFCFKGRFASEKGSADPVKKQYRSLQEETTDTENDDLLDFKPPAPTLSLSEEIDDSIDDVGGEYVTFYFANSYARRSQQHLITPVITIEDNYDDGYCTLSPDMFLPDPGSGLYGGHSVGKVPNESNCGNNSNKTSNADVKISADYDNLVDLWTRLGSLQVNCPEFDNTSEYSANSPVLRRVHSFTGVEEQGVITNPRSSFVESDCSVLNSSLQIPVSSDALNPSSPSPWLSGGRKYINNASQKSVSLPWSFHIGKEAVSVSPTSSNSLESPKTKDEKDQSDDFVTDLESYIKNSPEKKQDSHFPVAEKVFVENGDYTSRASTLYDSTVTINSVNLNHKIYKQEEECSVKNVVCSVNPKRSISEVRVESSTGELVSHSRSKSCDDNSNKPNQVIPMGTKFVQSLGKAYFAVMKQKHKASKSGKPQKPNVPEKTSCLHKLGSSAIGARVAYPLDSEYCMLDNFLPLRKNREEQEKSSRPDSLLSASSNISSSDSDKMLSSYDLDLSCSSLVNCFSNMAQEEFCASRSSVHSKSTRSSVISLSSLLKTPDNFCSDQWSELAVSGNFSCSNVAPPDSLPEFLSKDGSSDCAVTSGTVLCVDSPSESSDVSGDSYYEKTFEAIENVLAEEMFRDSAIYSDPDEIDLNSITREQNVYSCLNDRNEALTVSLNKTEIPSLTDYTSVVNVTSDFASTDTTSNFQHQKSNLFTRPVNRNIVDRLECLQNQNFPKNVVDSSSLKGLKSIRERWKELELWQNSNVSVVNSEPNQMAVKPFSENVQNTNISTSDENSQPKGKGWVKHVVNKLQNETS